MMVLYKQKQSFWRGCMRTALLVWTRIMQMLCKLASLTCFTCRAQRQLAKLRAQDRWANVGLTEEHTTPYSKYIKARGSISPCGCANVCRDIPDNCSMQRKHQSMTLQSSGNHNLVLLGRRSASGAQASNAQAQTAA